MAGITIGFAGLSHLGIVSGAAVAEKGFDVIGYDDDSVLVDRLLNGDSPVVEPDLADLQKKNSAHLDYTSDVSQLHRCDLIYIARDVPTDDAGTSDVSAITTLIDNVTPHARDDAVIVVLCQVPPGFTRRLHAADPRFFYQVETLIFARAVERALYPERFIVGTADTKQPLPAAFRTVLDAFDCPILELGLESAELAKISINMCLVASIGVANTMAAVCEEIGADWAEIVPALRLDARIGPKAYLKPGLGLAGGNLERDLATVQKIAGASGADHGIVDAWIANSDIRKDWVWDTLNALVLRETPAARIAVLGLAYKENTHSTKNAASLRLLSKLQPGNVIVHDPVVDASAVAPAFDAAASAMEAVNGADVVVIVTPWAEYADLDVHAVSASMNGNVLIDPYAQIESRAAVDAGLVYATLGVASKSQPETENA
jgi:UDPglucose 6-dehydrogenase